MQDSRWSCANAEFNKNVLKYKTEIQSFAYVSLQEQNLRGHIICYLVIPFKTNSQTGSDRSQTKESSGTLGITLERKASTEKLQVPMPWSEVIRICTTPQLCVISDYHPVDNLFCNNLREAWYALVFCRRENVFLICSKNVLNQSNTTYLLDYMSSDSFEQKPATLHLRSARLQLQAKWKLGILYPVHRSNLSLG